MTNLVYRGITHTASKTTTSRQPVPMMYRGVAHDGVTLTSVRKAVGNLVYRGVVYARAANGQTIIQDTQTPVFAGSTAFAG